MSKLTTEQSMNRAVMGVGVKRNLIGEYVATAFSSTKTFNTEQEANNWLTKRGF